MSHFSYFRGLCCAVCLCASGHASGQEASACLEPGLTMLTDAAGDVDFQFLPAGLPVDPYDVQSLHVAQPAQEDGVARVVFTLKTASLAQLAPRQAWFATFISEDKRARGVRMVVDEQGAASFQSYAVLVDTDGNITEGRYPETGSVKPAEGSFDADGTIRIVVDAADIGIRKFAAPLSGFNAASLQQIPTGDTLTPSGDLLALVADGMPDSMERGGEFAVSEVPDCSAGAKTKAPQFGGAFGAFGGLALFALAALRRKRLQYLTLQP